MTTSTPNLALVLYNSTTDSAEYFSNFRATIAGTSLSSNFYKIDTAYGIQASQITDLQTNRGAIPVSANYVSANYYEASGISSISSYTTNLTIVLNLDTTSSGTVTLNINSLGTKSLMKMDSSGTPTNLTGSDLRKGKRYLFIYDGTRWLWIGATTADQINIDGSVGNFVKVGTDNVPEGIYTLTDMKRDNPGNFLYNQIFS